MPPRVCQRFLIFWKQAIWPGLGLLSESFLLFSIGTLHPVWQLLFPECFDDESDECDSLLVRRLTYSVVMGIVVGMVLVGAVAGTVGRRRASYGTAGCMCGGALALSVLVTVLNTHETLRYATGAFFVFGLGVGGEYPLSAAYASERAAEQEEDSEEHESPNNDESLGNQTTENKDGLVVVQTSQLLSKKSRGHQVQLVFSMQGMGIFLHCLLLGSLVWYTGQGSIVISLEQDLKENVRNDLFWIWRIMYWVATVFLVGLLLGRVWFLEESTVWQQDQDKTLHQQEIQQVLSGARFSSPQNQNGLQPALSLVPTVSSLSAPSVVAVTDDSEQDMHQGFDPMDETYSSDASTRDPLHILVKHYGTRVFGASACWFFWDVAFYGNKLFQSTFLLALTGEETTLGEFVACATINAAVALVGYWGAALLIDRIGRTTLQLTGFVVTGVLFLLCGLLLNQLPPLLIVALYWMSSLTGQLGPNATTFLIPAEIVPTGVRTWCHGIAAASGKLGALTAAVFFGVLDNDLDLFLTSAYASFTAAAITYYALPEVGQLDLLELDRQWHCRRQGKSYQGPANHPGVLSVHERTLRKTALQPAQHTADFYAMVD